MEGMGVGGVMNVERRMPMGEGVIVVLIVSSMSVGWSLVSPLLFKKKFLGVGFF